MNPLGLVAIFFALMIGLIFLLIVLIRMLRQRLATIAEEERAHHENPPLIQELRANFFGMKSAGMGQVRGNGALLLFDDVLVFLLYVPRRKIEIPISAIRRVGVAKSHLGKSIFRPLLLVEFVNREGIEDSVAFFVPDLDSWLSALSRLGRNE